MSGNHFRLPIVQGGTFTFLAPTFAILTLPEFRCPDDFASAGWGNMTQVGKCNAWMDLVLSCYGRKTVRWRPQFCRVG